MNFPWKKALSVVCVFTGAALTAGCGDDAAKVTITETRGSTITRTETAPPSRSVAGGSTAGSGPVMPNVDETQIEAVTQAATSAFERDWGDGSGVNVVWGPNIVSGWALLGLENNSGAAGKDVLLAQENGAWLVKDMGHALSEKWESQTPPGFWPSM